MLAQIVTLNINDIPLVCRDPNDNVVLACAYTAGAEYIVTGDHDLLTLKKFHHVAIIGVSHACQIANSATP
jgi:predicted nucleic acid-binding protein